MWELYEVMATDDRGHESLYYATKSLKEAKAMAQQALREGSVFCIVNLENDEGDVKQVYQCGDRPK